MAEDSFKDLQRRVADALGLNAELRHDLRRLLGMRGKEPGGALAPESSDWPRIHRYLREALSALDAGFADPEWGLVRSRLIREGTCACVHVRLRQTQPLRACLQSMMADALRLPAAGNDASAVIALRRVVRLALSATAPASGDVARRSSGA